MTNTAELSIKEKILAKAVQLAGRKGYRNVTRQDVATALGIAAGSVSYHFKDLRKLQAAVIQYAVDTHNLPVVGQGLAEKHPRALAAKGIALEDVRAALSQHNVNLPTGILDGTHQAMTIVASGQLTREAIEQAERERMRAAIEEWIE